MTTAIFDDLTTLADATRSRMLLLLERHELTVSELCTVLQLPQSTVSRHLKTLSDAELGCLPPRRHEPVLHAVARRARRARASAVVAAARSGQRHRRRRSGCPASEERARPASVEVAGVFRISGGAMGQAARGSIRHGLPSAGAAGASR